MRFSPSLAHIYSISHVRNNRLVSFSTLPQEDTNYSGSKKHLNSPRFKQSNLALLVESSESEKNAELSLRQIRDIIKLSQKEKHPDPQQSLDIFPAEELVLVLHVLRGLWKMLHRAAILCLVSVLQCATKYQLGCLQPGSKMEENLTEAVPWTNTAAVTTRRNESRRFTAMQYRKRTVWWRGRNNQCKINLPSWEKFHEVFVKKNFVRTSF